MGEELYSRSRDLTARLLRVLHAHRVAIVGLDMQSGFLLWGCIDCGSILKAGPAPSQS